MNNDSMGSVGLRVVCRMTIRVGLRVVYRVTIRVWDRVGSRALDSVSK